MTYDPVDSNDDGTVDADVDNESVNTDKARISNGPFTWNPDDGTLLEGLQTVSVGNNGEFDSIWLGELIAVPSETGTFGETDFQDINGAADDTPTGVTVSGTGMQATTPIVGETDHTLNLSTNDASVQNLSVRNEDTTSTYDAIHISEREARVENIGIDGEGRHALHVDAAGAQVRGLEITGGAEAGLYLTGNAQRGIYDEIAFREPKGTAIELEDNSHYNKIKGQIYNPNAQSYKDTTGSTFGNQVELNIILPDYASGGDVVLGSNNQVDIKAVQANEAPVIVVEGNKNTGNINIRGSASEMLRINSDDNSFTGVVDGDVTNNGVNNNLDGLRVTGTIN